MNLILWILIAIIGIILLYAFLNFIYYPLKERMHFQKYPDTVYVSPKFNPLFGDIKSYEDEEGNK